MHSCLYAESSSVNSDFLEIRVLFASCIFWYKTMASADFYYTFYLSLSQTLWLLSILLI